MAPEYIFMGLHEGGLGWVAVFWGRVWLVEFVICGKYWQSHAYPIGSLKAVGSKITNSKTKLFLEIQKMR